MARRLWQLRFTCCSQDRIHALPLTLRFSQTEQPLPLSGLVLAEQRGELVELPVRVEHRDGMLRLLCQPDTSQFSESPEPAAHSPAISAADRVEAGDPEQLLVEIPFAGSDGGSNGSAANDGGKFGFTLRVPANLSLDPRPSVPRVSSHSGSGELEAIELEAEIIPLRWIEDIAPPQAKTINTLGNFGARFDQAAAGGDQWRSSADGAVLSRGSLLEIKRSEAVDIQIFNDRECWYQAPPGERSLNVAMPVRPIGETTLTIRAAGRAEVGDDPEEARVSIAAETRVLASLPLARRFVKGVDIADGHVAHSCTDLALGGPGLELEFVRTYSNLAALGSTPAILGYGWTHNYVSYMEPIGADRFLVVGGEGSGKIYQNRPPSDGGNGTAGYHGSLQRRGTGYELTTPAGIVYHYGRQSSKASDRLYLSSIRDRNNNETRLRYSPTDLLIRVDDAGGARSLRFHYKSKTIGGLQVVLLSYVELFDGDDSLGTRVSYRYDSKGNLSAAARGGWSEEYDYTRDSASSPHRLSLVRDARGGQTRFDYGAAEVDREEQERVKSVTDPEGHVTRFSFHRQTVDFDGGRAEAPLYTEVQPVGASPTVYHFDPQRPAGMVIRIEEPGNRTTLFDWRYTDRLIGRQTDPTGKVIEYDYRGPGNLYLEKILLQNIKPEFEPVLDLNGRAVEEIWTEYGYNNFNLIETVVRTDIIGGQRHDRRTRSYEYDAAGNVVKQAEADGRVTRYQYDNGLLQRRWREGGESVSYSEYNALGQPARIETNGILVTRQTYDRHGRLRVSQDEIGGQVVRRTETDYDELGHPREERRINAAGSGLVGEFASPTGRTRWVHSAAGDLQQERSGRLVRTYQHDKRGNIRRIEERPLGNEGPVYVKQFEYDAQNRVTLERDRRDIAQRRTYDELGRLIKVVIEWVEDGTTKTAWDSGYSYWGQSSLVRTIDDQRRARSEQYYDGLGRLVRRVEPTNEETRWQYDSLGNLIRRVDANGATERFECDGRGRKTKQIDPLGHVSEFRYDIEDRPTYHRDGRTGLVTETSYDGLGRLAKRTEKLADDQQHTHQWTYQDASHRVVITSAAGATTHEYRDDRQLLVRRVVDPAGLALTETYQYNEAGHRIASVDACGAVTRRQVDGLGRQLRVDYQDGVNEQFAYDGEGNLIRRVDRSGSERLWRYDSRGRMTVEWVRDDSDVVALVWRSYDDQGRQLIEHDAEGRLTTSQFDLQGRIVQIEHNEWAGQPRRRGYKGGRLAWETDCRGFRTSYEYDLLGRLTVTTDPYGHETRTSYDQQQVHRTTDRNGNVTEVTVDAKERVIERRRAGRRTESVDYDADDRVIRRVDSESAETIQEYDPAGRLIRTRLPGGRVIRYAYNGVGSRTHVWLTGDPERPADCTYHYDLNQRLMRVEDAAANPTDYEPDGEGRVLAQRDAEGLRREYCYDAMGNIKSVRLKGGDAELRTDYGRDRLGRLTEIRGPSGAGQRLQYDSLGRRKGRSSFSVDGAEIATAYLRDADGNLLEERQPDGSIVVRAYDKNARLATLQCANPAGAIMPYPQHRRYQRDPEERLIRVESRIARDGAPTTEIHSIEHDAFDRIRRETNNHGRSVELDYDGEGRRTRIVTPAGTTNYSYDARGRLETAQGAAGAVEYTYDEDDRLRQINRSDGFITEIGRNSNGWIVSLEHFGPGGLIVGYKYDLNRIGDVVRQRILLTGSERENQFYYDAFHRLREETYGNSPSWVYAYDEAGRRDSIGSAGRVLSIWSYDAFGRLDSLHTGSGKLILKLGYTAGGKLGERWREGSLLRVWHNPLQEPTIIHWGSGERPGGPISDWRGTTLDHDHLGRRTRQTGPGDQRRSILYLDDRRVEEIVSHGADHTWLRYDFDETRVLGLLQILSGGERQRWLTLSDRNRTVTRCVLPSLGAVAQEYSAFGRKLSGNDELPAPFGFAGSWLEPFSNDDDVLAQMGARTYDAALARFWSPDPADPVDTIDQPEDPYAFAHDRPTSFIDPSGWFAESLNEWIDYGADLYDAAAESFDRGLQVIDEGIDMLAAGLEAVDEGIDAGVEVVDRIDRDIDRIAGRHKELTEEMSGQSNSSRDGVGTAPNHPRDTMESMRDELDHGPDIMRQPSRQLPRSGNAEVEESRGANHNQMRTTSESNSVPDAGSTAGAGWGLAASAPEGPNLRFADSMSGADLRHLTRGVLRREIGFNAGRRNPTSKRRKHPAQGRALRKFRRNVPRPPIDLPTGQRWEADHRTPLWSDLTERSGTRWQDYQWKPGGKGAANQREGSRGYHDNRNVAFKKPAGAAVKNRSAGRWYNQPRVRNAARWGGRLLTVKDAYDAGSRVKSAYDRDAQLGTERIIGENTVQVVAEEAAGWIGAEAGAAFLAPYGAPGGPVGVFAMGMVGGMMGYMTSSAYVRGAVQAGMALSDQGDEDW